MAPTSPAVLLLTSLVFPGAPIPVHAQSSPSASALRFELASIKLNPTRQPLWVRTFPGGRLVATAPVKLLTMYAYGLAFAQISGGPDWINSDRYDIDAKGAASATRSDLFAMLRTLLGERFQMKSHQETREASVYNLTVGKSGPKLTTAKLRDCPSPDASAPPPQQSEIPCGLMRLVPSAANARMEGDRAPMSELVRLLSNALVAPVQDKTNLTGLFDIRLQFSPDPPGTPSNSPEPSIFSALHEQLGLKLESAKSLIPFLIIDHVERPTAN